MDKLRRFKFWCWLKARVDAQGPETIQAAFLAKRLDGRCFLAQVGTLGVHVGLGFYDWDPAAKCHKRVTVPELIQALGISLGLAYCTDPEVLDLTLSPEELGIQITLDLLQELGRSKLNAPERVQPGDVPYGV